MFSAIFSSAVGIRSGNRRTSASPGRREPTGSIARTRVRRLRFMRYLAALLRRPYRRGSTNSNLSVPTTVSARSFTTTGLGRYRHAAACKSFGAVTARAHRTAPFSSKTISATTVPSTPFRFASCGYFGRTRTIESGAAVPARTQACRADAPGVSRKAHGDRAAPEGTARSVRSTWLMFGVPIESGGRRSRAST